MFSALAILGLVLMGLGVVFCGNILTILNAPAESFAEARSYLTICSLGMVFIYGYNGVCGALRGMGESRLPLVFVAIATVINIVLDLLFVGGMSMGAAGAAWATILGQAVAFIISMLYLYRNKERFGFDFKPSSFKIEPKILLALTKIGLPLAVQQLFINISMLFVNSHVNTYGVVASAVDSIGGKINSIMGVISSAMNAAGAAMIGQNMGAGKPERIKKIYWSINGVCMAFWVLLVGVFVFFPRQIFSIFTQDPEALAMAPTYLHIAIIFYLSFATMSAQLAVINGVGNASFNMILAILDGVVVRIFLAVFLENQIGLTGLWIGNGLAGFTTTILGGLYYFSGRWKSRALLLKDS
jgi:putative MATE family efflux protein